MVARHQVLRAFDDDVLAEHGLEDVELGAAQPAARPSGVGDGAVVLDEQHRSVGLGNCLGQVALVGATAGQAFGPCQHARRPAVFDDGAIGRKLRRGARVEDGVERVSTEAVAHRAEQFDGEIGVAVGEDDIGKIGEVPRHRWPTATDRSGHGALDQSGDLECFEVLADGGVGQAELKRQLRGRSRLDALQAFEDPALRFGQLRADLLARCRCVAHRCHPIPNIRTTVLTK